MNLIDKVNAAVDYGNFEFFKLNQSYSSSANLATLIKNIINVILFIAGVMAVIYMIYSGILYITAAGNPDAAKKGQQGIINAVIGIVVIVLAWAIVSAVSNFAGGIQTNS